ncbi:MAG: PAS domain-containing protein, partial [Ginsengibacter sp.]
LNYDSGGVYDSKYTIVNSNANKEIIVHAKGKSSFNEQGIAYRLSGTLEDITEETLARRKIEENEEVIRSIVSSSPAGICVINSSNFISEMVNERFLEISNKSREDIIGKHYWECFSDARPTYEPALKEVIKTGIPYFAHEVEYVLERNGKEQKAYSTFVFAPIKNEEGELLKVAIWAMDNTPQMEARKKIAESERNLKLMILQAPVAIAILRGPDYIVQIANKNALNLWGRTGEEVIGKSILSSMPEIQNQGIPEILEKVIKTGKPFLAQEYPVELKKDGVLETVYINFSFEPLYDAEGKTDGIMAIGISITEQVIARQKVEEREQEIRALVESAPFPIGVFAGKEMRIVLANQSIMDAWGKGNDVIGKLFSEILPELENQQIYKQLDDVFTTGIPFHFKNQQVTLLKDGELKPHYFNYSLMPLFDTDGNIYGVMNTAAEVTELNEAKQSVEAALEELKLYKYMADNAGDPFILMDKDANFIYVNKSAVKMWGYSGEEIKHLKVPDIDPLYTPEKFTKLFDRNKTMSINTFETLHKHKSGLIIPVEVNIGNVQFKGETFMFGIGRNITERKKAEQDLLTAFHKIEDSEKRFRDSVEQAPLGIAIFRGPDHVVELANKVYLKLIDAKAEMTIGFPFFETLPQLETTIKPLFNQVIETGQPFIGNEFPVFLTRMDKIEEAFFNLVYHPLKEENGDISGIMLVATEVTETVKAKRLLE